jgi:DNA-binding NarL/FixJ family response regulator
MAGSAVASEPFASDAARHKPCSAKPFLRNQRRVRSIGRARTFRKSGFCQNRKLLFNRRAAFFGGGGSVQPGKSIRILIAEDPATVRRVLAPVIEREPDFHLVAKASDGVLAAQYARRFQPQIILLDLQTPRLDGVAATRQMLRDCPGAQVIIHAAFDGDDAMFNAICAGAQACLHQDSEDAEFVETIRAVARGQSRLAPGVTRKLIEELRRVRRSDRLGDMADEPLTERENDILQRIVEGKGNKEIAADLGLAEGTVKNYVSRILEKLNVRSRTELAIKTLNRRLD